MKSGKRKMGTLDVINDYAELGRSKDIIYMTTDKKVIAGKEIQIRGKELINFGSCSYFGLEQDPRLIQSAKDYMDEYGVQFSSSRSYLSCHPLDEYEQLLSEIFGKPAITFTSVSLGHHAVVSVVMGSNDLAIMDQQVHRSVQDAILKTKGLSIEIVRHNRIDLLEQKIQNSYNQYDKIWYAIDGVYSMYGDYAPIVEIEKLLNKYPKLHLYADDAHGMSIAGKNGSGVILDKIKFHDRMILGTSLNKAFASGGGVFLLPDQELARRIKNIGGTYIFSGPPQVATIGAGIASAKIHLSNEIITKQEELKSKIHYCHQLLIKNNLPVLSNSDTPIFFIGVGLVITCFDLVHRLHQDGFFVNPGIFPAVPDQSAGVRFTITIHHTFEDIDLLVDRIAYHFPRTFQDLGRSVKDIHRGFKKIKTFNQLISGIPQTTEHISGYSIQHETTIKNIDEELWNQTIGSLGANDYEQIKFFEKTFSLNPRKESNWKFHYYIVRDQSNTPVIVTYFTEALTMDDMFSSSTISKKIAHEREILNDPYHLSSKTLTMGCLLSVGKHLFMDESNKDWKMAMLALLEVVQDYREHFDIPVLSLRDFDSHDLRMKNFFLDQGFKRIEIPNGHVLPLSPWQEKDEFLSQLQGNSAKSKSDRRRFVKNRALKFEHLYQIKELKDSSDSKVKHIQQLYKNVSAKNFEISGFELHEGFFKTAIDHANWEVIELFIDSNPQSVGMAVSYKTKKLYSFLVTGIDYSALKAHDVYAQILWQCVKRANTLKLDLNMGLTASQSKRKFGPEIIHNSIYVQNKDNFKDVIIQTKTETIPFMRYS